MENIDRRICSGLMDIGAVMLRPSEPFTWASGWKSPIYCDNRRILSSPSLRSTVAAALADEAAALCPEAGVVAGVATGAIAVGVLAAEKLGKPFVYVRPKPKDHGTGSQIEGVLAPGDKVVVIEDLISTGMSSLAAVEALRAAGAEVLGMVAIFTYGFDIAAGRFRKAGVPLVTLADYNSLIETALQRGFVGGEDYQTLLSWRHDPASWGK